VVRGLKFRFYPTPEQRFILARTFGSVRYIYNWALNMRTEGWYQRQERINYAKTSAALTKLKKQPELEWLNEVSSVPLQQSLRNLQVAFVNFWNPEINVEYPKFKKKDNRQSAEFTRAAFDWDGNTLSISKLGALKVKWSRSFTAIPSTVTVSMTPSGRYYVSVRVDEPVNNMPKATGIIGIDVGLTAFATASNGAKFHSPRPLKRKMAQLKRAQKALSRKQKGSKNRGKAKLKVAKIHQKISDIRNDFLHKLTTKLVRENQTIVTEDLNVRGMMANHCLAGAISDSGWGEFFRQIDYKCEWYERTRIKINRFYPSTKRMSCCGHVQDVALSERIVTCQKCGKIHDRDVNAAINIKAAGLAVSACGGTIRPGRSRQGKSRRNTNRLERCA
jgi:putative transposase